MRALVIVLSLLASAPFAVAMPIDWGNDFRFLIVLSDLEEEQMFISSTPRMAEAHLRQAQVVEEVAKEMFLTYLRPRTGSSTYSDGWFHWCDRGGNIRFFLCLELKHAVARAFYEGTMKKLRESSNARIKELVYQVESKRHKSPRFRVQASLPTAGFMRGLNYIFLNYRAISPERWYVIFIHELIHHIDETLWDASFRYDEEKGARTRLLAGLNRGFLAEWRAWTATFSLYLEAVKEGLVPHSAYYDEKLANVRMKDLKRFTFEILDPAFVDPPYFFRNGLGPPLRLLRDDLRAGREPLSMGNLQTLLHPEAR